VMAGKFGIQVAGTFANACTNAVVTNNIIGSADITQAITCYGISATYTNNLLIQGNEILGPPTGMSGFYVGTPIGISISSGVTGLTIKNNVIHDIYSLDPTIPATGIYYASNSTTQTEISNNLLYNIKSVGSSTSFNGANTAGIYINTGGNFKIQHNSIWLEGSYLNMTTPAVSVCVIIRNSITNIDFRNNILKNSSQLLPGGTAASKSYCIAVGNSPSAFNTLDYNDYYCDGVGAVLASYNSVDKATLAAWQSATGLDAHALNIDPVFTSATNLLPTTTAMPKAGTYIPTLPTDFAGVIRTNPPDMGAYEFSPTPVVTTTAATNILPHSATLNGTINPTSLDVNVYFDYGLTSSYGTTVNGTPFLVNGGLPLSINAPIAGLLPLTTYHFRIRAVTFGAITVYGSDMTFTTTSGIPENFTISGEIGGGASPCLNASNTITVAGNGSYFSVQPGSSVTFIAWQRILFKPGASVLSGAYMHGYISFGTYCNTPSLPSVTTGEEEAPSNTGLELANFSIYPNPTTGNFTLVQKGVKLYDNVNVEVYSIRGEKVAAEHMIGEKSHEFGFNTMPTGLYFVKVVADGYVETLKLVKL
jgi:hypothetical protein